MLNEKQKMVLYWNFDVGYSSCCQFFTLGTLGNLAHFRHLNALWLGFDNRNGGIERVEYGVDSISNVCFD